LLKRLTVIAVSVAVRAFDITRGAVRRFLDRPVRRHGVVLYYHAVKPHQRGRFATQMDTLLARAHPFDAGSPDAMRASDRNAAVTFDDGLHSVVENAVPELAKRRIPFTVFVPSGCLGQRPPWVRDASHPSWAEQVLSAGDLRSLAAVPLATLGSHSVMHRNLLDLDRDDAAQELTGSRAQLEAATGTPITLFSFPHGRFSPALLDLARQAGYRRVFTIEPRLVDSDSAAFVVGRVAADPDDWPLEFRLKIAGAYRWRQYLHRRRRTA
jgi:peptidoglycan/xylan/chitin deacetylase (PgdA/CDA1 family)